MMICAIFLLPPPIAGQAGDSRTGVIEGSLSYPSDFIPPDMTVCAENLATHQKSCTKKYLKGKQYTYKLGYKLTLPPGD
jgi:hypothetical protein